MESFKNVSYKSLYFYRRNNKQRTAGYDKWICIGPVSEKAKSLFKDYFIFENKRTKERKRIKMSLNSETGQYEIPEHMFWPINDSYNCYFHTVVEYYVWHEKMFIKNDNTFNKQYEIELQQIQEKYPEYFI
jgi:hypothetical protein